MISNFTFKVKEKRQLAKKVFFFVLELQEPGEIEFKAGQFLQIKLDGFSDSKGNALWKPYSICSSPIQKNRIELVIDTSPDGPGSHYFEKLQEGEVVLAKGAFGVFNVCDGQNDLVFIATGSGIAPIRGMIEDLREKKDQRRKELYFGVRYPEDVYFFNDFETLAKDNLNLKFYGTVSRPDDHWGGLKGRVTDHLEKLESFENKDFYLCGSPGVVDSLKIFLVTSGVSEEKIHYEQY